MIRNGIMAGSDRPFHRAKSGIARFYRCFKTREEPETVAVELATTSGEMQTKMNWFLAVKENNIKVVRHLLSSGTDVNAVNHADGWSALHYAAWNGYDDLTYLLIKSGAAVDQRGPGGITPLALSSQQGHLHIVQQFLKAGCDLLSTADIEDSHGVSSLHVATQHGHTDIVKALLQAGAAVNATMTVRGIQGVTPLHLAVETEQLELIDILIEAGSDVNRPTKSRSSIENFVAARDKLT